METVERLARIEGAQEGMAKSLERISGFLERSVTERTAQHTETVKTLAVLGEKCDAMKTDMKDYQTECSAERSTMKTDIKLLEKQHATQAGKSAGIAAAISIVFGAGGLLASFFKPWGGH